MVSVDMGCFPPPIVGTDVEFPAHLAWNTRLHPVAPVTNPEPLSAHVAYPGKNDSMFSEANKSSAPGQPRFTVTWWGVRGSTQVPGPSCTRFGGNTTCLEIRCDDERLIIDAGTGLRAFGQTLDESTPFVGTVLFTHYHLDHIVGLPFFAPIFRASTSLRFVGDPAVGGGPQVSITGLMTAPYFPVEFARLPSTIEFGTLQTGVSTMVGLATVKTCPMNHPGGATGLRIEHRGHAFVHLSDLEHSGPAPAPELVGLARGADALSYDAMFDEDIDYEPHRGWGHSTWQAGARLAIDAGVGRYIATHHAPEHDDAFLDGVSARMRAILPSAIVAWEGLEIDLLTGAVRSRCAPPNALMAALVADSLVVE